MDALDFWWECLKRSLRGSWDKANGLSTILGAILLWIIAEYWGYHVILPETFIGAVVLALVCLGVMWLVLLIYRLLTIPAVIYAESQKKLQTANELLTQVGLERHFFYDTMKVIGDVQLKGTYNLTVSLQFLNTGDKAIRFEMKNASVEINGFKPPAFSVDGTGGVSHPHQPMAYHIPTILGVAVGQGPVVVLIDFDLEYDNIPPIKTRTTGRTVEYKFPAFDPRRVLSFIKRSVDS